ncbi:hypothetical protein BDN71DRAFT_1432930, partial [Pleurotus eryngii]
DDRLSDEPSKNTTITASNQFFTPVKQAVGFATVDIGTELHPHSTLAKVDNTKWVHTEDNEVSYYVLGSGDDEGRYKPTTPIIFQVGNIIELQALLICIPTKGDYTVEIVLRSLVLLNGELTTEATMAKMLVASLPPISTMPPPRRLKGRNPYASHGNSRKGRKDHIEQAADEDVGQEASGDAAMENVA